MPDKTEKKLTFQDEKYRTNGLDPVLAFILQKKNELEKKKAEILSYVKIRPPMCTEQDSNL